MKRKQFLKSLFGWGVAFGGVLIYEKKGFFKFESLPWDQEVTVKFAQSSAADGDWHHHACIDGKHYLDGVKIPVEEGLLQVGKPSEITYKNSIFWDVRSIQIHEDKSAQLFARIRKDNANR